MTKFEMDREARESVFGIFGVSRFALYIVAGLALMSGNLFIAGLGIVAGASIEITRRFYFWSRN